MQFVRGDARTNFGFLEFVSFGTLDFHNPKVPNSKIPTLVLASPRTCLIFGFVDFARTVPSVVANASGVLVCRGFERGFSIYRTQIARELLFVRVPNMLFVDCFK